MSHLEFFPVEINQADYYELLRVPGIGYTSARRIIGARRTHSLEFADLKRIGVVLKRALYFITCNGRMMYNTSWRNLILPVIFWMKRKKKALADGVRR